jgi:Kef-type K+ transport system membrane component KefB/nucleotide-binding universal stress UspA family protein
MAAFAHAPLALFIAQAAIIIACARGIGLLARRIGQPMVIAEVVAGILLGPSLFGWLAPGAFATFFPRESMPTLGMLSQVGLVLFMFLIGLELDLKLLRGRGHASVIISHTSIIVPCALGALLGLYLYPRVSSPTVPFASFVLFMGVAMSITAFPVLARILVERRLLGTKVGALTITCAAVDDVTAWCLLAFVVSFVRSSGIVDAARTTLFTFVYIGGMVLVVRPFLRRLAARSDNREGLTQNRVAATLLVLLASSLTTELIGIHALFGAFMLGAVMPKDGGFARTLADKLEDLVVVFLLPLFFAYSGLRTQIALVNSPAGWIMCALVTMVACVGKFGGSAVAARLTGLTWRESGALGILMNTRGLMELIVLNIGLDLGVISPTLFTMMVIMALVTTFMTTPLLQWVYPQSQLAVELTEDEKVEEAPAGNALTVLMCVAHDRSGPGMMTLASALGTAGDRLYALRLVPSTERASYYVDAPAPASSSDALSPLLRRAEELGVPVRPLRFVSSRPADDICRVAEAKRARLVLLGWHKPLLGRTILGGVVHDVMENARADVGILVDRGLDRVKRVLVPYQGTADDKSALRIARLLTRNHHVTVTVLHVVTKDEPPNAVREQVAETFEDDDGSRRAAVTVKLVKGEPAPAAVAEAAKGYDLVVIGASGQWGLEPQLFGLMPEQIVAECPVSLLILRGYDRQSHASPAAVRDPYQTIDDLAAAKE